MSYGQMGLRTWISQLFCIQLLLLSSQSCAKLCSHEQSSALLQFKQLFSFESETIASVVCGIVGQQSSPKMLSWEEDRDCCSWDGVTCDMVTGHVIGLDLSCSWLYGDFPSNGSLSLLPHLHRLNLAYNDFNYSKFPPGFGGFPSLKFLNLSFCNFMGSIPASLGNFTQLVLLDLSFNSFLTGQIPLFLSNLKQISHLNLASSNLIGKIPDIFTNLTQLSYLDLSNNQLSGPIPYSLNLQNLDTIYLSHNSLNGIIPSWLFTLPSLVGIALGNNQFIGSIPSSISEAVNLTYLDLSANNLRGNIVLYMFAKLKNLESLYLSRNTLSLSNKSKVNSSFPNLHRLGLSACSITEFPEVLRAAHQLKTLDLSENKINGKVPYWMWNVAKDTLSTLNLSQNFLTDNIEHLSWKNLKYLDLHSNLFRGSLGVLPPLLKFFSVSRNKLTGKIPSSFCNLSSIEYLDLSNNNLSGNIPKNLGSSGTLSILNLQKNNFNGRVPQSFAKSSSLTTLNLNGNQLEGPLPPSLVNCRELDVFDVGNNRINDTFPYWLAQLPQLQVLILRSNKFHGPIGGFKTKSPFPKLRILDLSRNDFNGDLPTKYFQNFEAMMQVDDNDAQVEYMPISYGGEYYSVSLTLKGSDITMERILTIFMTIDLSGNHFEGEIPEVVGKLNSLKGLNFSHNNLTGSVPASLGNLTALESLDLSSNKLVGHIPKQLANLTSLSVFNVSYNQLNGSIPQGPQFNTFTNDSYTGNLGLCGFPLLQKCSNDDEAPKPRPTIFNEEEDDNSSCFDLKVAKMGYGSGLVIGLSVGYIIFTTGRPLWLIRMVERKKSEWVRRRRGRRN